MRISIDVKGGSYDIILERGCLGKAAELINTDRKCLIVTDEGVPAEYAECIASQCREPVTAAVPQGESGKSMQQLERLLTIMLENGFTRSDCVIAVGGGVPGDLAGFAAATYMRGIDYYNIPTTVLSQADSSIGGKTAVNLAGVKNIVGAFWQPKGVLIDPDTLKTLPDREKAAGMAEIVKAGIIADAKLFEAIEAETEREDFTPESLYSGRPGIEPLLEAALRVKKRFVEEDERESGERRKLNFGHTIGHGIESVTGLLHGECVAAGMVPMCSDELGQRLTPVLEKLGLSAIIEADAEAVFEAMLSDKKMKGGQIAAVYADIPGESYIRMTSPEELREKIGRIVR